MKVFSSDCLFDYSWDEVSTANWRKYCPWNDKSTHVIAVDTLSRSVDADSGILRTERLISCKQSVPSWVATLLGGNNISYVHETSYVDPTARRVTMVSSNLTWSNILTVRETVIYEPPPQTTSALPASAPGLPQPERTRFRQEAQIIALCGGWQKIRNKVEEASIERFAENAKKGREGFEAVLQRSRRVFCEEREKEKARQ